MIDLQKSLQELQSKSDKQIELEAAWNWASRACAAYTLAKQTLDPLDKVRWFIMGHDYRHEALEHASLYSDRGKLVADVEATIDQYRDKK